MYFERDMYRKRFRSHRFTMRGTCSNARAKAEQCDFLEYAGIKSQRGLLATENLVDIMAFLLLTFALYLSLPCSGRHG